MWKKIIPFWIYPYSWGLTGVDREIARAKYQLSGHDLSRRLVELDQTLDDTERSRRLLELDYQRGVVSRDDYLRRLPQFITDHTQRQLATLSAQLQTGEITQNQHDSAVASARGEPWVTVVNMSFGSDGNPSEGSFELDWNQEFVELLRTNGVPGATDEDMVNFWFIDICRSVAGDDFADATVDPAANLEAFKRFNDKPSLKTYK